jgi:hypothetical protein
MTILYCVIHSMDPIHPHERPGWADAEPRLSGSIFLAFIRIGSLHATLMAVIVPSAERAMFYLLDDNLECVLQSRRRSERIRFDATSLSTTSLSTTSLSTSSTFRILNGTLFCLQCRSEISQTLDCAPKVVVASCEFAGKRNQLLATATYARHTQPSSLPPYR